ncbi:MAG: hypothetical protein Q4A01_07375 [Coriobacteriales bacterium]|nr:hypothetical protein [Coriobacteriales bacterium]
MRIAVAQLLTRACDFVATTERMVMLSERASAQGAELLVFPFATLTGAVPVDFVSYDGYALDLWDALTYLSQHVACPCLVPYVQGSGIDALSDAALVRDGEVTPVGELASPAQRGGHASGQATSGVAAEGTFTINGVRMGMAYSYEDIDQAIDANVSLDVLVFASVYGFALDDPGSAMGASLMENRFRADATMLDAWVVGAGSLGAYGNRVFDGASFVLAPSGELAASAASFDEALIVCDVDPSLTGSLPEALEPELYNKPLHLWETLVLGLRGYAAQLETTDVVLALDGGLHTCLLAALATDALGPTHVHGLLTCADERNVERARELGEALRIDLRQAELPEVGANDAHLAWALPQAHLMAWAASLGAVCLSAEDKTFLALEVSVGVGSCAALLPFGDVYRSDVMEMAHMRNTISPIIPASCFLEMHVPAIEGLSEAEGSAEACLRRVDVTLATHIEWARTVTDTIARQGMPRVTQHVLDRYRQTEAGRQGWPEPLAVSSRTLHDARLPLGIAWADRQRTQEERLRMDQVASGMRHGADASVAGAAAVERMGLELSGLFGNMDTTVVGGALPEGVDKAAIERSVEDLLGLLQDIMQSGGVEGHAEGLGIDGPFGPLTWGGPFSEN